MGDSSPSSNSPDGRGDIYEHWLLNRARRGAKRRGLGEDSPIARSAIDILTLLPPREGFSTQHFGAIALCVRDFVEHSRYRDQCTVVGGIAGESFPDIPYISLTQKRWWQTRSYAYARACLELILSWGQAPNASLPPAARLALLGEEANSIKPQHPPALVEVHNRPNLARYLCRHWRGKVALHLHNDPQEMKYATTVRERQWLLDRCAAIYCVSEYIRDRFVAGLAGDTHKAQVVYNGMTLPNPATFPPKQKHILFVGRLKPEKGALEFAQAMAQILPEYHAWKAIFIGATRHQPGAKTSDYERQIRHLLEPLGEQVEMRGFCNYTETMQATAEATIAVIPSTWHEAFGRTALEAMANGCLTISSTRGGLREVIGDAALPLYNVTAESICNALRHALTHPEQWECWQKQVLAQAQNFSIEACTKRLDDIRANLLCFTA